MSADQVADGDLIFASVSHELGSSFVSARRPTISFGRSTACDVSLGTQPVLDLGVPRRSGRLLVVDSARIAVENTDDRIAFDVATAGQPIEAVRPGAIYSPPMSRFEVRVSGSSHVHVLVVEALHSPRTFRRSAPLSELDEPATMAEPSLSERQWAILELYTQPIRDGRPVPATHARVADSLGWSMATIRIECGEIWNRFLLAGVPMRDFPDKRDAIVDAAIRHHLAP